MIEVTLHGTTIYRSSNCKQALKVARAAYLWKAKDGLVLGQDFKIFKQYGEKPIQILI